MSKRRQASLAGAAITLMMLTAACGGSPSAKERDGDDARPAANTSDAGKGYGAGYGSGAAPGAGAATGAKSGAMGEPGGKLAVRETADLGRVVTDGKGFTLYRFDKDTAAPPASNCDGDCAKAWPPVPAADASATTGIEASALGEVARKDGSRQLTLGGWPVYRYAKDTAPGDTKGQGVGGTWNALAPDGKKAGGQKPGDGKGAGDAKEQPGGQPADGVSVSDNPKLGKILVDGQGRTLYRFAKDSAWPMKFACTDACLETWKPAGPVDKAKIKGIAEKLITTVTRPDGTRQLAADCWPLYWFTGDTKAGDVNGQGKQGQWFAVDDKGRKVTAAPAG
ncbi:SCO0930 family lipoprotein [Streptomyces sp. SCA3-4]|uniref:SCO0930 family lipoprotein n=1 Tax=Streptomyces sichuanensis TaxID=2871810 RepID=UPI001CE2C019|nr:SCO0930 family lipoprotein [Streptomyces sichuanensis]MCA6095765.1 SCO0930 family lipoprotein [Streptomyces sichuanensis]